MPGANFWLYVELPKKLMSISVLNDVKLVLQRIGAKQNVRKTRLQICNPSRHTQFAHSFLPSFGF
jgi:hypothetical protein